MAQVPLDKLKQYFGADSVLYLSVPSYGTSYQVINSTTRVEIEAKLVDINTGALLWAGSGAFAEGSSSGNNSLLGTLVSAAVSQVMNSATDRSYDVAKVAGAGLLALDCDTCILRGAYHKDYKKDKQLK